MTDLQKGDPPRQAHDGLVIRSDELRTTLRPLSPEQIAERSGSIYQCIGPGRGEFHLSLFDSPLIVTYPDLISYNQNDDELPIQVQALLLYYFHTSDGTPLSGQWVSFADLPDGRIYNQAFQGYTGNQLVKAFGLDAPAFERACQIAGGLRSEVAELAFVFQALPRLSLLLTYWCGDEDFPSSCKVLFDRQTSHYLPTDVCAILGSMLIRRILKSER